MLVVTATDGMVRVVERPRPTPGRGEIGIRVRAAGINAADLLQAAGRYPAPAGVPADILGLELAGEVAEVGEGVLNFGLGDRVMAVVGGGCQAEYAVVDASLAMAVPSRLNWEQAGALPEVFTTAYDALFAQCGLQMGDRLLVHGAAGGVGMAAVQLGVACGAKVTATVRRSDHRPAIAALGANVIAPADFGQAGPFDVILELVGAQNLAANLDAIAVGGRIMVIGVGAGAKSEIDLRKLMARRVRLSGSTLRARPLSLRSLAARQVEHHVLPLVEAGMVKIPVFASYPLEDAATAYADFAAGGKLGKLVLRT